MDEYIERKVVINRIKEYTLDVYDLDLDDAKQFGGNSRIENYCEGLYEATELVDDIPAADVAPIVHGHWELEYETYGKMRCSVCKKEALIEKAIDDVGVITNYVDSNYCPNCGAKMDRGINNV